MDNLVLMWCFVRDGQAREGRYGEMGGGGGGEGKEWRMRASKQEAEH